MVTKLLTNYLPISSFSRDLLSKTDVKPIIILHGMLGSSQNWTQVTTYKPGSFVFLLLREKGFEKTARYSADLNNGLQIHAFHPGPNR